MRRNRQDFRQATQAPLVVLAGLPHPICAAVAKSICTNCSSSPRVIFQPSGNDGRQLYKENTVALLVKALSDYAVRQLKAQMAPPSPKHILLAYVPAHDEERLLAEFEFFVFPVRLSRLADYDEFGRQRRHDPNLAEEYAVASLEAALREFMDVKRRLSSLSDREPLSLPPQNFKLSHTERMADMFRKMLRQVIPWTEPISYIQRVRVTSEDLPKNIRQGAQKVVLSDVRGLLFPHDHSRHGPARELLPDCPQVERKHFMRSAFRFGVPLTDGDHHDVQHAGHGLRGERFECCRQGYLDLKCSHANIYPNDFVRPSET